MDVANASLRPISISMDGVHGLLCADNVRIDVAIFVQCRSIHRGVRAY